LTNCFINLCSMSYCREEGKDKLIFVTKDDHTKPSTAKIDEYSDDEPGLILDNGDINWSCPCLGGMATGPCGFEFREAFTCFHVSKADPKGSDCYDAFRQMQDCMIKYPTLYESAADDGDDVDDAFNALDDAQAETSGDKSDQGSKVEATGSRSGERSSGDKKSSSSDNSNVVVKDSKDSSEVDKKKSAS